MQGCIMAAGGMRCRSVIAEGGMKCKGVLATDGMRCSGGKIFVFINSVKKASAIVSL